MPTKDFYKDFRPLRYYDPHFGPQVEKVGHLWSRPTNYWQLCFQPGIWPPEKQSRPSVAETLRSPLWSSDNSLSRLSFRKLARRSSVSSSSSSSIGGWLTVWNFSLKFYYLQTVFPNTQFWIAILRYSIWFWYRDFE